MNYSVVHTNNDMYRITITSNTDDERKFLESPISEIEERLYQYFDQAVKEKLGEEAFIASVANNSGLPYEIHALITIRNQ